MRYTKSQATGQAGVLFISNIVNQHGSVFRPVHQEDDFGVDGFIELVDAEEVSGRLVAIQSKCGDSYLAKSGDGFLVPVDDRHLHYWREFALPVILVCYSATKQIGAWTSIRDYVEGEEYHERLPVRNIHVPFSRTFSVEALSKGIAGLAHIRMDERKLLQCADQCLDPDPIVRRGAFQVLSQHPSSREMRITCLMARNLLLDEDTATAKDALFSLGFGVGRRRWSMNPNDSEEGSVIAFASELSASLTEREIRRIIELVDNEGFHGPAALGERCYDVLCCSELAQDVLAKIIQDTAQPIARRANCLLMEFDCDEYTLAENAAEVREDAALKDVVDWLIGPESRVPDDEPED